MGDLNVRAKLRPLTQRQREYVEEFLRQYDYSLIKCVYTYRRNMVTFLLENGYTKDDVEQLCRYAATYAASLYSPDRGVKFSSYAMHAIFTKLQLVYKYYVRRSRTYGSVSAYGSDDRLKSRGDAGVIGVLLKSRDCVGEVVRRDECEVMESYLGYLPEGQRVMLCRLYGVCGYERATMADLAAEMGISTEWLKVLRDRALAEVRSYFDPDNDDEVDSSQGERVTLQNSESGVG